MGTVLEAATTVAALAFAFVIAFRGYPPGIRGLIYLSGLAALGAGGDALVVLRPALPGHMFWIFLGSLVFLALGYFLSFEELNRVVFGALREGFSIFEFPLPPTPSGVPTPPPQ